MSHDHSHSHAGQSQKRLRIVFVLTSLYFLAEVVAGFATHSLALLADAGHMFTDIVGPVLHYSRSGLPKNPPRRKILTVTTEPKFFRRY